jgi:hypothetical protein
MRFFERREWEEKMPIGLKAQDGIIREQKSKEKEVDQEGQR